MPRCARSRSRRRAGGSPACARRAGARPSRGCAPGWSGRPFLEASRRTVPELEAEAAAESGEPYAACGAVVRCYETSPSVPHAAARRLRERGSRRWR